MARKLRVQYEGAIYHVTLRGVERRTLFTANTERERFLLRLGEAAEEYGVRVYLYCLMSNHVHLVVETPQANVSAWMHKLQTAYTVYFNLRHHRTGHLVQGRFGAQLVQGDEYLLKLSRYVHLNPVFVGAMAEKPTQERVKALREYAWSSYPGYVGLAKQRPFVVEWPILAVLGGAERGGRRDYARYVEAGVARSDSEFMEILKAARWGIGDEEFQGRVRDRHTDLASRARRPEDVAFRLVRKSKAPEAVLSAVAEGFGVEVSSLKRRGYGSVARAVAARLMVRHCGYSQRDAGAFLRMGSSSAVCQQIRRLRERQELAAELTKTVSRISDALEMRSKDRA